MKEKRNQFRYGFDNSVYTAGRYVRRRLDGADYERGEIETIRATADNVLNGFAELVQLLYDKGVVNRSDIENIVG
jgi:hypothetical protein